MSYPLDADVAKLYTALGLDTTNANLSGPLKSAITWWGRTTGYEPYLGTSQTRSYDPPGGTIGTSANRGGGKILRLDNGLLSLTSLTTMQGALTSGTQFWLRPNNAPNRSKPYEWIEFLGLQYGAPQSIVIVGTWGREVNLSDDAFEAIVFRAGALAGSEIISMISKGFISWTDGDTTENYGVEPLKKQIEMWGDRANEIAAQSKRVVAFF